MGVIELKTFMLVLAIGNIAFALLIAGYAQASRATAGLHIWQWAKLIQGASHLVAFFALQLDNGRVDALADLLLIGGVAVEVAAYAAFLRRDGLRRALLPVTALVLLVYSAATPGDPVNSADRVVLRALTLVLFSGMMAYALLSGWSRASALQRLVGINQLVFLVIMLLRAGTAALGGSIGPFSPTVMLLVAFMAGYAFMIVNGFGFLLLCKQHDDQRMQELATVDSLTGLVNRRAFFERTEEARALSARLRKPVALMMLDIDHFKRLNDRFGHATGDEALCVFAQTVRSVLREHDIVGRLGGEEFALAMPGTDLAGALQAAERVRMAVAEAPVLTDGNQYTMTVSVGVVLVGPGEPINSALARADNALYAAKTAGRNRVESGESLAPQLSRA